MRFETAKAALDEAQRRLDATETPADVQLQVDPPQGDFISKHVLEAISLNGIMRNFRAVELYGPVLQTTIHLTRENIRAKRKFLEGTLRQLIGVGCTP